MNCTVMYGFTNINVLFQSTNQNHIWKGIYYMKLVTSGMTLSLKNKLTRL